LDVADDGTTSIDSARPTRTVDATKGEWLAAHKTPSLFGVHFLCEGRACCEKDKRSDQTSEHLGAPALNTERTIKLLVSLLLKESLLELTFNADEPFFGTSGTVPKVMRFGLKLACSDYRKPSAAERRCAARHHRPPSWHRPPPR
jgi:hypothetical protein